MYTFADGCLSRFVPAALVSANGGFGTAFLYQKYNFALLFWLNAFYTYVTVLSSDMLIPYACAYALTHLENTLTIGGLVVNAPADVAPLTYKIVTFRMTAAGVGLWGQVGVYHVIRPIDCFIEVFQYRLNLIV